MNREFRSKFQGDQDGTNSTINRDSKKRNMLNRTAVYVGGPSSTGKSTTLNYLKNDEDECCVSNISYAYLWSDLKQDAEKIKDYMLNRRDGAMIYEHTHECLRLYDIIHKYMARLKAREIKSREYEKLLCFQCYNEVNETIVEPSLQVNVILLDTTRKFKQRYFERLRNEQNGIDYEDVFYLYLQIMAYVCFLTKKQFYTRMILVLGTNEYGDIDILGEEDKYDIGKFILSKLAASGMKRVDLRGKRFDNESRVDDLLVELNEYSSFLLVCSEFEVKVAASLIKLCHFNGSAVKCIE